MLIYMKGRELAIKSTTTRHHISHSHRPSSRLTSTRGEAHISRHYTHKIRLPARVAEALDAYPMAGAQGSQLSALLRPCSACRGSWSSPMQHLAASAAHGAEGEAGRACAAGSSWASGMAGAVPQGRLWLEEETTLHRMDVSCSAAPALPYLPHGGREGRCNGHLGGVEGGSFLTRVCKLSARVWRVWAIRPRRTRWGGSSCDFRRRSAAIAP